MKHLLLALFICMTAYTSKSQELNNRVRYIAWTDISGGINIDTILIYGQSFRTLSDFEGCLIKLGWKFILKNNDAPGGAEYFYGYDYYYDGHKVASHITIVAINEYIKSIGFGIDKDGLMPVVANRMDEIKRFAFSTIHDDLGIALIYEGEGAKITIRDLSKIEKCPYKFSMDFTKTE